MRRRCHTPLRPAPARAKRPAAGAQAAGAASADGACPACGQLHAGEAAERKQAVERCALAYFRNAAEACNAERLGVARTLARDLQSDSVSATILGFERRSREIVRTLGEARART